MKSIAAARYWPIALGLSGLFAFSLPLMGDAGPLAGIDPSGFWLARLGQSLLHGAILLGARLSLRPPLRFLEVPALLAGGALLLATGLIDELLFSALRNAGLIGLNPQPLKLALIAVLASVNLILCLRRRTRSPQRIFASLILGAALATTGIFHAIIVESLLHDRLAADAPLRKAALESVTDDEFLLRCKLLEARCLSWADGRSPDLRSVAGSGAASALAIATAPKPILHQWTVATGNPGEETITLAYRGDKGENRLFVDATRGASALMAHRHAFYALQSIAGLVWLLGGGWLAAWHARRFERARGY